MPSIFIFLFFFCSYYAGFAPDIAVFSPQDFVPIDQLQKSSRLISYDVITNAITRGIVHNHKTHISSQVCKVICDNDISFIASLNQLVRKNGSWCAVKDLKKEDRLVCYNRASITVQNIYFLAQETVLVEITVSPSHTFFITSIGILVHNNPIAVFAIAPPLMSALSNITAIGVIGGVLWNLFSRKKSNDIRRSIQESSSSDSSPPPPKKPNDEDEFRKKHRHGRYEDVGYHHKNSSGTKSAAPIDGQKALDNSLRIKDTRPHRIGISEDQFVVLRETSPGLFHGYVCEWEQLTDTMQKILRNARWVTHKGKIVCKY